MCGLETRSRVAVSWLEPNYRVFGKTTRECVARRWCAGDGIMCVTGQYVKEMALFNGLWEADFETVGRGQYDVGRTQVDRCV